MFKKILVTLLLLVVILPAGVLFYLYSGTPDYGGDKSLSGLNSKTEVIFDSFGVPHIYAENMEDAYFALGYVHAQDRLFQMELIKRVGSGKLSEIIGPDFIRTDKFFRTLNIRDVARKSATIDFANSDDPVTRAAQAYQDGINQFIETGPTPPEFTLMGIPKVPFTTEDIYYVAGYLSLGFAEGFRSDPLLTFIKERYGEDYLEPFAVNSISGTEYLPVFKDTSLLDNMVAGVNDIISSLPLPLFHGSNSWVVGPDKTESGNVVLANDTHIGFSQPAVWYEAHLEYPGNSLYGHFAAGFPFAILGHNSQTAWGMTMLENDDVDFYIHARDPEDSLKIRIGSNWERMSLHYDTLAVKGQDDVIFPIYGTSIGPVMNSSLDEFPGEITEPVSVSWTFLQSTSPILKAVYQLSHSQSVSDIMKAAETVNAPGLNIMGADTQGNYSWYGAASLTKREGISNSKVFFDARTEVPQGLYGKEYNPTAMNTPWGYVYSSNNQPDTVNGILHYGYYMPEDRAQEIREFLDSKEKFSTEELAEFQTHVVSKKASEYARLIVDLYTSLELPQKEREWVNELKGWDGSQDQNLIQPGIYYMLLAEIFHHAMNDELKRKKLDMFTQLAVFKRSIGNFIDAENNPWWNNIRTEETETREDILLEAAVHGYEKMAEKYGEDPSDWTWDKMHTLTHPHVLGSVDMLKGFFNVGPLPVDGGIETVNNMMFTLTHGDHFTVRAGPAMRRVIDMGDIAHAKGALPSGQSGHFLSPHYDDQAEMYSFGEFRILMTDKEEILSDAKGKLTLYPNDSK